MLTACNYLSCQIRISQFTKLSSENYYKLVSWLHKFITSLRRPFFYVQFFILFFLITRLFVTICFVMFLCFYIYFLSWMVCCLFFCLYYYVLAQSNMIHIEFVSDFSHLHKEIWYIYFLQRIVCFFLFIILFFGSIECDAH